MNAINNLAEHATAVADGSIIEHQKKRLAELEAAYSVATKSLNYELTQDIAKRIKDARQRPHKEARWS